jgi:hypothetical protein
MLRRYLLPLLAVVGVAFATWTVVTGSRPVPAAPPIGSTLAGRGMARRPGRGEDASQ